MNAWIQNWPWWLIDFQLAAAVLLGGALIAARWLRHPAQRVALGWGASLALVLAGVIAILPAWPRWHTTQQFPPPPPTEAMAAIRPGGVAMPNRIELPAAPAKADPLPYSAVQAASPGRAFHQSDFKDAMNWLARLFFLGSTAICLWLGMGMIEAGWVCRTAEAAPARLRERLLTLFGEGRAPPRLLLSRKIPNAVAVGILRPTILLPAALAETADPMSLDAVLAHESAHIRNRDLWLLGLLRALLILLFPNPLFWGMRRMIRASQEELADATAAGQRVHDYAAGLIEWMRRVTGTRRMLAAPAVGIWERSSELARRIDLLMGDEFGRQTKVSNAWRNGLVVVVTLLALGISMITVRPATATNDKKPLKTRDAEPQAGVAPAPDTNKVIYSGTVIDKVSRQPIPGATVRVKRDYYSAMDRRPMSESEHTTDANGRFEFRLTPEESAERHTYIDIEATHPDYSRFGWEGYALGMIRKNEALGEKPFFDEIELVPAEHISGTVLKPDGTPAAGVKVLTYSKAKKDDWAEHGSFLDGKTDAAGVFRINVIKGGEAVLWLLPQDFAPSTHLIHQERGNLGQFNLEEGIRLSGRVLDNSGAPVNHVWVNAEICGGPARQNIGMPVADALGRSALSDAQGRFAMRPLPAGDYNVLTSDYPRDETPEKCERYPVHDSFLAQKLQLKAGQATESLDIRAVMQLTVAVQQLDGKSQPHKSHEIVASGRVGDRGWWDQFSPDETGKIVMKVPKGLTDARFTLMVNEHQATRYRWSKDSPWRNEHEMAVPVLDQDSNDVWVIYYTSPIVLVRAVTESGSPVSNFKCSVEYAAGRKPSPEAPHWINGMTGDVNFEKQQDGRWRSEGLLPDENLTLTVEAEGFKPWTSMLSLHESETREVVAKLEKQ